MSKKKHHNIDSALNVQKGIEQPSQINPKLTSEIGRFKKENLLPDIIFHGIITGDRTLLSRGITLIESDLPEDMPASRDLIQRCLPYSGSSVRIGISGVPGVGKSTFIETFGMNLIAEGKKVAVLAIDPSSKRTKGSILGDKTRMEILSINPHAFIRPSASKGTLGGVARATREALILCEAAGFNIIMVETVGVGQSETEVSHLVDFFLLLMLAGGGDELQGIKRGIMEMADLVVINKADGDNIKRAELAASIYKNALHLFPALPNGWAPEVLTASAIKNKGIKEVWEKTREFLSLTKNNGFFENNRREQAVMVFNDTIEENLRTSFYGKPEIKKLIKEYKNQIYKGEINPYEVAQLLLDRYFKEEGY
ncbi:MAG: methylmalonyl Co-A mutase-associated GTPase MeaB [Bacteroidetes bacterium]|nr:methylmalonyl Co-A mutase-associated GTPase MeaB [Bacteroidota bacterium]MBL6942746.1 methylmalonyl Co-A mutase-associated GTPase MeaB [Bacteroidales bacterium]